MTILHLTTFLQGGAGAMIVALATAQRTAGHAVAVVASATPASGYGNYAGHLERLGTSGVDLQLVDSLFTRELSANLAVVAALAGRAHRGELDIVHAHAAVPAVIAMVLGGRSPRRLPVLQTMHGWGVAKTPEQHRADVTVLGLVDRVIVPARAAAAQLAAFGVDPSRVGIIPWAVEPLPSRAAAPHPVEEEIRRWRGDGGVVVCCAGTVGARKNQRLLVDAIARLEPGQRPLAIVVGEGALEELTARAAALGVSAHVRLTGYHPDARHIAAACDAFVLPSLNEGQPIAVLEAIADGVPVLGSRIPELEELVRDGVTGILFDPRDAGELARVLVAVRELRGTARAAMVEGARVANGAALDVARVHEAYLAEYRALRQVADA